MTLELTSEDLIQLVQDAELPADTASYAPAICLLLPEATQQQQDIAQAICDGFGQASIDIVGNDITVTCDNTDTSIWFSFWDSDGELQHQTQIAAVIGVANYTPAIAPGEYKLRVYGTISHMSNFEEMTVT
jgi:hypothetical protein